MNRSRSFAGLAAAVLLVATASLALAQGAAYQGYWALPAGTAGSWSVGSNWNSTDVNSNPTTGVPWAIAYIDNGGTATIGATDGTVTLASEAGSLALTVGDANGSGWLNVGTDGTLGPGATFNIVEQIGTAESGIVTQTGGIHCPYTFYNGGSYNSLALGTNSGAYGEYDLSGGSLGVNVVFLGSADENSGGGSLGGTGVFNQTGGSIGILGSGPVPNKPVALMIGGNWAGNPGQGIGSTHKTVTDSGNYTLSDPNNTGRSSSAAARCRRERHRQFHPIRRNQRHCWWRERCRDPNQPAVFVGQQQLRRCLRRPLARLLYECWQNWSFSKRKTLCG